MSFHFQLVDIIREVQKANPKPAATIIDTMTDEEVIRMIFVNIRNNDTGMRGLQLSQGGLAIMKSFFKSFEIVFPDEQILSSRHILYMDRICTLPWYASFFLPITITFFEPDLAMRAKLVGNLDVLLSAFE